MELARVIQGEICFSSKEAFNILCLFHTRYCLHKQVYSHKVAKAVELMICDVLAAADTAYGFSEILNVSAFILKSLAIFLLKLSSERGLRTILPAHR